MKKTIALTLSVLLLGLSTACAAQQAPADSLPAASTVEPEATHATDEQAAEQTNEWTNGEAKPATEQTAQVNAEVYQLLDFSDEQEGEFAQRGFITAPDSLVLTG